MAVKDCSSYMNDDMSYNMKQIEKARQGKSGNAESLDTDYSIKGKQMKPHNGEAS